MCIYDDADLELLTFVLDAFVCMFPTRDACARSAAEAFEFGDGACGQCYATTKSSYCGAGAGEQEDSFEVDDQTSMATTAAMDNAAAAECREQPFDES